MPEFIADTDGVVDGKDWDDLDAFTRGYIECMLFTETCTGISMVDWLDPENVEDVAEGQADGSIPTDSGFGDIHPRTLATIIADCEAFQKEAAAILAPIYDRGDYDAVQAGRDFWFTRNGHGVGYWDRKELEKPDAWESFGSPRVGDPGWNEYIADREDSPGNQLSAIAKGYGETWSQFDPDEDSPTGYGFVYLT